MSTTVSPIQKLPFLLTVASLSAMDVMTVRVLIKQHGHGLTLCQEETFGPIVGIQKVTSDKEAIQLMNDSPYGLTASVWTNVEKNPDSEKAFLRIAEELDTGTVFLNR